MGTATSSRDHVLILDFAARFARRAQELLSHSGYRVLVPRSIGEAFDSFEKHRHEIAFILATADHVSLASSMQAAELGVRVFLFDGPDATRVAARHSGHLRKPWLSSLGTFP